MRAETNHASRRAGILLAILLIATGLAPLGSPPPSAHADPPHVHLSVGDAVYYDNYSTNFFTDENGWIAYCAQPSRETPPSGSYPCKSLRDAYAGGSGVGSVAAVLYYGFGGPGFDPNMWPSTWYDGSPMNDERYYAITHILVADRMFWDANAALTGCSYPFWQYYGYQCQGQQFWVDFVGMGSEANHDATYMRMISAWQAMPSSIRNAYIDSCYAIETGGDSQVIVVASPHAPTGSIELIKTSGEPSVTDDNASYSLEGARFAVYADAEMTDRVAELVTDAQGYARADDLPPGTYYVREVDAPSGFTLDQTSHEAVVSAGETTSVEVADAPIFGTQPLSLLKIDAEAGKPAPQGNGELALAEYTFAYYDGVYATGDEARAAGDATRTWTLRSDENGVIDLSRADESFSIGEATYPRKVSGDEFYKTNGEIGVPLGTLVIKEAKPPAGYGLSTEEFVVHITADGDDAAMSGVGLIVDGHAGDATLVASENVLRGGVSIAKLDAENGADAPLGSASLDGAAFAVVNESRNPVIVDGTAFAPGETVRIITSKDGIAATEASALPFGTYTIAEIAAGDGYLLTDGTPRAFAIAQNGVVVALEGDQAAHNQVKRGDLAFVKARESDQARLGGIPFKITSKTTGESHVIVTDENGEARTAADFNAHTRKTNANDAAVRDDGTVDESKLDPRAGIWFGAYEGGSTKPDDRLGALPYDDYAIEELRVAANENLELITLDNVTVSRNGHVIDLGTFDDQPQGEVAIATSARSTFDGSKTILPDTNASFIDRVTYEGLTIGKEYRLTAQVFDVANDALICDEGGPISATTTFTAKSTSGFVEVMFDNVDTIPLAGCDIVIFETLEDVASNRIVAEHADATDYEQTLKVVKPSLATSACDALDGDRLVTSDPAASIIDEVHYANLTPGVTYLAEATLTVKQDGADAEEAERDDAYQLFAIDGETVTASATFTPEAPAGTVAVRFADLDLVELADRDIVVFETLYRLNAAGERIEIARHADVDARSQTVHVTKPALSTSAHDGIDGDSTVVSDVEAAIIDTISFENVVPGRAYTVESTLIDKARFLEARDEMGADATIDDLVAAATAQDAQGKPVASSTEITFDSASGTAEIPLSFDASRYADAELVVFETLHADGKIVAEHRDVDAVEQTVRIVNSMLKTLAIADSGDHGLLRSQTAAVTDRVTYEHLIPGAAYELVGTLMNAETGEPVKADGKPVRTTCAFVPEQAAGNIDVALSFDATSLDDGRYVMFEQLLRDGQIVAEHADLADEDQSVYIATPPAEHPAGKAATPKTGDDPAALVLPLIAATGAAAALTILGVRTRKEGGRIRKR